MLIAQVQVASLRVVGQHGSALAEHEAGDVGGELDLVVDKVVLDLLPVDEVPEGGQVLEAVRAEAPVGHGGLVEDEVRVPGQLQESGDEAVGVEVLLGHEGHLVEVVHRHGEEVRLAGEELDGGKEIINLNTGSAVRGLNVLLNTKSSVFVTLTNWLIHF